MKHLPRHISGLLLRTGRMAWLCALIITLTAFCSGCVHEFPKEEIPAGDGKVEVILDMHLVLGSMPLYQVVQVGPDADPATRASSKDLDFRYIIDIYDAADTKRNRASTRVPSERITLNVPASEVKIDQSVSLRLKPGDYDILVWGDYVGTGSDTDLYYNTADLSAITVIAEKDGEHQGNSDDRQAFRGMTSVAISEADLLPDMAAAGPKVIHLKSDLLRPMARFVFISTDVEDFLTRMRSESPAVNGVPSNRPAQLSDYRIKVIYTGYMPFIFNAYIDKPTDSRQGQWFYGSLKRIDTNSATLGFDYMFVNGKEAGVQLGLEIYSAHTGKLIGSTGTITAPLMRGKTTEIRGRFLTAQAQDGVGIDPGFDGEFNIEIK